MKYRKDAEFMKVAAFITILFTAWILRQFLFVYVDSSLSGLLKTLFGILIKLIVWIGLVFLFQRFIYREKFLYKLKFRISRRIILYTLVFGIFLLTLNLCLNVLQGKSLFSINLAFGGLLSAVIFAPIIEEITFRGFILTKLKELIPCPWVNILTSILFVGIHIPGWVIWGDGIILKNIISIFVVSFVFGSAFVRTKNIGAPILLHGLNNLISMIV